MKKTVRILTIVVLFKFTFCKDNRNKISNLLSSDDKDSIMNGIYMVGEARDTSFVGEILKNPFDTRISHNLRFKGMSLYRQKMIAMKKLTDSIPPNKITDTPDSTVIQFYLEIAKKRGWIPLNY